MKLNKLLLRISILVSITLISCNESADKEIENKTLAEISMFYFKYKSIENDLDEKNSLPKERGEKSKQFFITSYRISLKLDEDWQYSSQNLEVAKVSPFKAIVEITTYFEKDNLAAIRTETFYYDMTENDIFYNYPIPIEDKGVIVENEDIKEIFTRQIWRGQFDEVIKDLYREIDL